MRIKVPNRQLIPVALLSGFILASVYWVKWDFERRATHTTAYVVDKEQTFHNVKGGGTERKIGVSFLVPGQPSHYAQTLVGYELYQSLKEGDTVPILYDSRNLDRIETTHDSAHPPWVIILQGVTLGLLLVILAQRFPKIFLKKLW